VSYNFGESAWLQCTNPGCPNGTHADPRHLPNLTASGGWKCHAHDGASE
jgi:hypothetical protein